MNAEKSSNCSMEYCWEYYSRSFSDSVSNECSDVEITHQQVKEKPILSSLENKAVKSEKTVNNKKVKALFTTKVESSLPVQNNIAFEEFTLTKDKLRKIHNKAAAKRHREKVKLTNDQIISENQFLKSELKLSRVLINIDQRSISLTQLESLFELLSALIAPQVSIILKTRRVYDLALKPDFDKVLDGLLPSTCCKNETSRTNQINYLKSLVKLIKAVSI